MTDTSSEAARCYWGEARTWQERDDWWKKTQAGSYLQPVSEAGEYLWCRPRQNLSSHAEHHLHISFHGTPNSGARNEHPPPTSAENCHNHLLSNCQSDIEVPTMFLTSALSPLFLHIYHRCCCRSSEWIYLHCILLQDHLGNLIWPPPHLICDPRRNFLAAPTSMGHPNKCPYIGEYQKQLQHQRKRSVSWKIIQLWRLLVCFRH